jgi:hypothetical protein
MIPINFHPTRRELRLFSLLWFPAFLALVGVTAYRAGAPAAVVAGLWGGGLLLAVVGAIAPARMRPVFVGLSCLTFPLGVVVSAVVLTLVFLLVITPVGLLLRTRRRDPLLLRLDRQAGSYWHPVVEPSDESYFRQL